MTIFMLTICMGCQEAAIRDDTHISLGNYRQQFISKDRQGYIACGNISTMYSIGVEKAISFFDSNRHLVNRVFIGYGGNILGAEAREREWVYFLYHNNSETSNSTVICAYDYVGYEKWKRCFTDRPYLVSNQNTLVVSEDDNRIIYNMFDANQYLSGKTIISDLDGNEVVCFTEPYSARIVQNRALLFWQNKFLLYDLQNNCELLGQTIDSGSILSCPFITPDEKYILLPIFQPDSQEGYVESIIEIDVLRASIRKLNVKRNQTSHIEISSYELENKRIFLNNFNGRQVWEVE